MACPRTETTLLWIYGEAPDEHARHVAECPDCAALLAEHEGVATALGPALAAIRGPVPGERVLPTPVRAGRTAAMALALAAAVALVTVGWLVGSRPAPVPPATQHLASLRSGVPRGEALGERDALGAPSGGSDPIEAALDDLDREVLDLELELL